VVKRRSAFRVTSTVAPVGGPSTMNTSNEAYLQAVELLVRIEGEET
jgi:hypothetical protein